MKSRIAALLVLFAVASAAPLRSQTITDDPLHMASRTELDIVKVVMAQERSWNQGDLEGYVKAYKHSPDIVFIGRQVSKGYDQLLSDYRHNYPTPATMGQLGFSELEVHSLSATFAVCVGKYHLDRSKREGGPADGIFSLILEKTDQGWQIVVDHTT